MANTRTTANVDRQSFITDTAVTQMAVFTIDDITMPFVFHDIIPLISSSPTTYSPTVFTCYAKVASGTGKIQIGTTQYALTTNWARIEHIEQYNTSANFSVKFVTTGTYHFACSQLEVGNKSTAYVASFGDYWTKDNLISEITQTSSTLSTKIKDLTDGRFTTIEQNVSGLTTRVGTAEGNISTLTQSVDALELSVEDVEGDVTTLTLTVGGLESTVAGKVGNTEVISKINQSAEAITINASKLNLTGYVTMTNLSTSGQTTINGGNITTGIITNEDGDFSINFATGKVVMSDGDFAGKIISTEGSIGDWKLDDKLLYSSTSDDPCSATNTSKQTVTLYSYDESYVGATQPAILVRKELWNADTSTVDSTTPFYISYDGHLVSDYGYIGGLTLQNNVMSAYADNSNKVFSASVNGVTMQDVSGQKSTSLANNLLTMTSATSTSKLAPTYLSIVLSDTSTPIASVQLNATYGGSYGRFVSYESKGDGSVGVYDHTNGKWMHVSVDTGDGNGYQYLRSPRRISFITDVVSISDGIDILKDESDDILKIRPKVTNQAYCGSSTLAWAKMYTYASPSPSDRKVKDILSDHNWKIDDFIMGLEPVVYKYKGADHKRLHMGFIAQDVKQLCDELELGDLGVYMADYIDERAEYNGEDVSDSELRWSLCYQEFISPIILELQRLINRVSELEERLGE